MKKHVIKNFFMDEKHRRYLIFFCTFILIYLVLITSMVTKKYSFKEGDIAKVNIKAQKEIVNQRATNEKIQQAQQLVKKSYTDNNAQIKNDVTEIVNSFFNKLDDARSKVGDTKTKIASITANYNFQLSDNQYDILFKLTKEDEGAYRNFMVMSLNDIYQNNRIEDNSGDDTVKSDDSRKKLEEGIRHVKDMVMAKVADSNFSKDLKDISIIIIDSQIKPNFTYDKVATEELKKDVAKKVPSVIIKKDQIIVKEGEPVTQDQLDILKSLGVLNTENSFDFFIYINLALVVLAIMGLQWFYIYKYHKNIYEDCSKLLLICVINSISVVISRSLSILPYLIPLACAPMLLALLIEDNVAILISILNCVLIGVSVKFDVQITMLAMINAITGVIMLRKMQQRNDILYSSLFVAMINVIVAFTIGFCLSNNIIQILINSGFVIIGSLISGVLTIGFLPFLESAFDIVTTVKLLELLNPNNPILKRLLMEAPGTYHHSILVANLAEVATEEVGGNPVLARVSSYYHDIGKIKRPYFFKENQIGIENPHNKITANLSTLIITSHVKDGLELAKEHKLPKVIQDVIEQHHGTTLVKYFYLTMKNNSDKPEDIKEEDFRYPGPLPCTKEAGIIMLADSVEASVRSIGEPTKGKIEEMVNNIIKNRLNEGQLDNCDLTLKDLDTIRKSFLKSLSGIYHQRIEYPTDKWANKANEEK